MKERVGLLISILCLFLVTQIQTHHYQYDLMVIGGGAAGLTAASLAADLGKKVVVIEKAKIGGGRFWSGDIPFKALFKYAELFGLIESLDNFGIQKEGNAPCLCTDNILSRIREIQKNVYAISYDRQLDKKNINIIHGNPMFVNPHTVSVNGSYVTALKILIATGCHSFIPDFEGINNVDYLIRENFFMLDRLPRSMVIVGGGPLGTELASALNRLGVEVTLLMRHGNLLPTYDFELVDILTKILIGEGVHVHCAVQPYKVEKKNDDTIVYAIDRLGKEHQFKAERLFLAVGGTPNVDGLGCEVIDLDYSDRGIRINDKCQTNIPSIYAAGDVVGLCILSRIAYYHAKTAVYKMFGKRGSHGSMDYSDVARVVFTHPQFASCGMTEQDAYRRYGKNIRMYHIDYHQLERAHIDQNTVGCAKFICDEKGILLGVHVLGHYAGEIVDSVKIGTPLDGLFLNELHKVRTSPSYFDLLYRVAYDCACDVELSMNEHSQELGWWEWLKTKLAVVWQ